MSDPQQKHPTEGLRWQGEIGEKWNTHHERFESMIAPIGAALIEAAAFRPGESVIDVGCGAGATTMDIARRIAPGGRVVGLDISPVLVRTAGRRARAAGLENAAFVEGDAATASPGGHFDGLFSRFGVMFFDAPHAAFINMHKFLKPGGRLLFACWGPMPENPWVREPMEVVMTHKELPAPVPRAPGPFAFAEKEYVRDILTTARFTNISFTEWRESLCVGGAGADAREAAQFLVDATSVGDTIAGEPRELRDRVLDDLARLFAKYEDADGVRVDALAWLVAARA